MKTHVKWLCEELAAMYFIYISMMPADVVRKIEILSAERSWNIQCVIFFVTLIHDLMCLLPRSKKIVDSKTNPTMLSIAEYSSDKNS